MAQGSGPGVQRPACEQDLQRIHEIAVAAWRPIFARYRLIVGEAMWQDLWGTWEQGWFAPSPERLDGNTLVTEVEGRVVGFAGWHYPGAQLAEVGGNAVDPAFQDRGIGTAQVCAVVARFRREGYPFARVHTGLDPAHGPARAQYRSVGLRLGVTRSEYYNYLDETARAPARPDLTFRWAGPPDADGVRDLLEQSWVGAGVPARRVLGDALFAEAIEAPARRRIGEIVELAAAAPPRVRLVVNEGRLVASAVVSAEDTQHPGAGLGTLESLAVHPARRDRGVGCALCAHVLWYLRERGLRYARLRSPSGGVTERVRRLAWNVGLHRELPSIDYYMHL